MPGLVIAPMCKYKTDSRRHWPIVRGDEVEGYVCVDCFMQIAADIARFADGTPPKFCHECGRSFASIASAVPGDTVKMFGCLRKDGCMQIICLDCDKKLSPKMHTERAVKAQERVLLIAQSIRAREAIARAGIGEKAQLYDYWKERVGTIRTAQ